MKVCNMFGNRIFPVICALLSVAQSIFAQHPYRLIRPSPSPSSWGFPNEILGSGGGPAFRPPPGVLIAGHGPPVARPRGPVHAGSRLVPIFSTSTPTPSVWPSIGPQIQRAKETSHFEYEVYPHPMNQRKPHPPRLMRPHAPMQLRSHIPTHDPVHVPPELLRILAQDGVGPIMSSPKPQSRTDRPPPPHHMGLRHPQPTFSPISNTFSPTSNGNFQEGFRILSDLFMEEAGADIRNNLVGGSEISFNGNYYPIADINAATTSRENVSAVPPPIKSGLAPGPAPTPEVEIAKEHVMHIPAETNFKEVQQKAPVKSAAPPPTPHPQMQQSESAYSPPQYRPGPPSSHVSFMFQDPNEAQESYSVYDHQYGGPPPPFHSGGNSVIPSHPPIQSESNQEELGRYQSPPPQQQTPQNDAGRYNNPPPNGNSIRSQNNNPQKTMMAMRIPQMPTGGNNNESPPSSEEIQRALQVLSRYASSQQAASPSGNAPHQIGTQFAASSNSEYGSVPQMAIEIAASPNSEYGSAIQSAIELATSQNVEYRAPKQEQSTPVPSFLPPSSVTPSNAGSFTTHVQGPSSHYTTTTTEAANTFTISAGGAQSEESSPFPQYGAPGLGLSGEGGGWAAGGGNGNEGGYGGGGQSGGYEGGSGGYGGGSGGGATDLIGAKVKALKSIQSAVTGGFKQITGLKAGIFNAGLNAIGSLGKAKGEIAKSLKIPIVPAKSSYGPPEISPGWGPEQSKEGLVSTLINGVGGVVGGLAGTVAQKGKAAVGIALSKNEFVKNHFAIKGQAFTETMSKKFENKNQYFQSVLKHVQSIFDQAKKPVPGSGWSQRRR